MLAYEREECPLRVFNDAGIAFGIGAVLGVFVGAYKGYRSAMPGHR